MIRWEMEGHVFFFLSPTNAEELYKRHTRYSDWKCRTTFLLQLLTLWKLGDVLR